MKSFRFSLWILGSLSIAMLPAFSFGSSATGTSVRIRVAGDQTQYELRQVFPKTQSLEEVRSALSDTTIFPQISRLIVASNKTPDSDGYRQSMRAAMKKMKITIKATTIYRCTERETDHQWIRDCRLVTDSSGKDGGKYLTSGRNLTTCAMDPHADAVVCVHKITAQPKPIHIWPVYRRNPRELGISGAIESIHDFGALYLLASTHLPPQQAKERMESSLLMKLAERMVKEGQAWAGSDDSEKSVFSANFSDLDGSYRAVLSDRSE